MKLDMNKDFETAYKPTLFLGLTARECAYAAVAFFVAAIVAYAAWKWTGMPPGRCVYVGLPVMLPIVAAGGVKFQGMTVWNAAREMAYTLRASRLGFEAGERGERARAFTTKSKGRKKRKRR